MRHMRFSGWLMLAACLTASGCSSSDQEELQTWMAQERANAKPRVKPLEEPKTFTPEAYLGSDGMDP
ncbi:MAG: pilus assembly protein PilP, partial [Delftia acidovorans]|nr:pilus assembly protein PilP [Delftia acidovorans]